MDHPFELALRAVARVVMAFVGEATWWDTERTQKAAGLWRFWLPALAGVFASVLALIEIPGPVVQWIAAVGITAFGVAVGILCHAAFAPES